MGNTRVSIGTLRALTWQQWWGSHYGLLCSLGKSQKVEKVRMRRAQDSELAILTDWISMDCRKRDLIRGEGEEFSYKSQEQCFMPVIPACRRHRQEYFHEFKATLGYLAKDHIIQSNKTPFSKPFLKVQFNTYRKTMCTVL